MLAEALDPEKKGVGAAQGSCLGDYMATFIERLLESNSKGRWQGLTNAWWETIETFFRMDFHMF